MFTILAKKERETPSIRLYPSIHPSSNQTPFSHPLVMTLLSSPLVHFRLPFFNHPMTLKKPVDVGDKGKGDGEVAHQTVKSFNAENRWWASSQRSLPKAEVEESGNFTILNFFFFQSRQCCNI
jgi:hypothetical protein